jgi:hypothetical protein
MQTFEITDLEHLYMQEQAEKNGTTMHGFFSEILLRYMDEEEANECMQGRFESIKRWERRELRAKHLPANTGTERKEAAL